MTVKTLNRSFAAGEISPQLFSRVDLDKYQTGLALSENFETLPPGPAQNRAGYGYILETKDSTQISRLIPFSYSTQQTFALEFGDRYIRFHTNGGTLLETANTITNITNGVNPTLTTFAPHGFATGNWVFVNAPPVVQFSGRWVKVTNVTTYTFQVEDLFGNMIDTTTAPLFLGGTVARVYEMATPYAAADVFTLNYVQSADVLTLVSTLYPPAELRRLGATNWSLQNIQFASSLAPPQSNGAAPNAINHTYRVISVSFNGAAYIISVPSAPVTVSNDFSIPGRFNYVSWASVPNGQLYYVQKLIGGVWGLIGFSFGGNYVIDDSTATFDTTFQIGFGTGPAPVASATAVVPSTTGVAVVPTGGGAIVYTYVVTSLTDDASEESLASGPVTATNDLNTAGNVNTVRWPAVPGVRLYNVYRSVNGIFGFVGRANSDCTFVDSNYLPDTRTTPPVQLNPFLGDGNYPGAVSYHQQRRVFGGTIKQPQNLWMTRSATERNMGYSFPSRDDDGITLRVVSREANTIRHLIPMNDLIMLTSGGEWKCAAANGGALTPANVSVNPQGYTGANTAQPVATDRTILFAQDRGGMVRELQYEWEQQGYRTANVSILAPHLFEYFTIQQMAFSRSPLPSLWTVRNDGRLLGLTYVPEQEVRGWHQHVTDGAFESVCVVSEGDEDVIYAIIRRFVSGRTVRYVERKHTRRFDTASDQFFVDSGVSYSGAPVASVSGLYHLEGKTVAILADAGVSPAQVVVNGTVSLDAPASKIHAGLPYIARLKTLPLSVQTQAFGQGVVKNVNKVFLRVISSNGFSAGPAFDKLRFYPTRFAEPYGSPPSLSTGEVPLTMSPMWQRDGSVCVEQSEPLSLMLLGISIETATGS